VLLSGFVPNRLRRQILQRAMADEDADVRMAATLALRSDDFGAGVDPVAIVNLLMDDDSRVRSGAVDLLRYVPNPRARQRVTTAVQQLLRDHPDNREVFDVAFSLQGTR
jgi:hypothetical protein